MVRFASAVTLLTGIAFSGAAFADADSDDDNAQPAAIMNDLLAYLYLPSRGAAPGLAKVLFGDIDRDGQPDAVVTYSHGVGDAGGNHYSQRLALFLNRNGRWVLSQHMRIGSKGSRFVKPVRIEGGAVVLEESFWQPGDAACCPSGRRESALSFNGKTLQ